MQILKLDPEAKLPERAHADDAGIDIFSNQDAVLTPGEPVKIKTGIAFAIPHAHVGLICDRSSMGAKGIKTLGGVVDSGYRGEVHVVLVNLRSEAVTLPKGSKVAQMLVLPVALVPVVEAESLNDTARGAKGFGSTGA